jgi:hypothetical protein
VHAIGVLELTVWADQLLISPSARPERLSSIVLEAASYRSKLETNFSTLIITSSSPIWSNGVIKRSRQLLSCVPLFMVAKTQLVVDRPNPGRSENVETAAGQRPCQLGGSHSIPFGQELAEELEALGKQPGDPGDLVHPIDQRRGPLDLQTGDLAPTSAAVPSICRPVISRQF